METICDFLDPIDLNDGELDPKLADWEYSKMICNSEEVLGVGVEIISDGENSFKLDPTFSYAEIVIIFFLISLLAIKIFSGIWGFVHTLIIRQKWLR